MSNSLFSPAELGQSRIRTLVALLDQKIELLSKKELTGDLLTSWRELVGLLALGPEPEVRGCPVCGSIGMRDAVRCAFCWSELTPDKTEAHPEQ